MDTILQANSILNVLMNIVWACLLINSVFMISIVIDRFIFFSRLSLYSKDFKDKILELIKNNDFTTAINLCDINKGVVANIVIEGLKNKEDIENAMLTQSVKEIPKIEKFISSLSTIATVAPLLGLLGTVLGMIESFSVLSSSGSASPLLANGIANALLTTAAGLIIAIPSVVFYNYFVNKSNKQINGIEMLSNEIVNSIKNK